MGRARTGGCSLHPDHRRLAHSPGGMKRLCSQDEPAQNPAGIDIPGPHVEAIPGDRWMDGGERVALTGGDGRPPVPEDGGETDRRPFSDATYPDWEAIYFDNVGRVYRLMFSRVGNRDDAEDLTTEVFLAALRPLRVSASVGEVRAYLVTTAQTVLASFWRKRYGTQVTVVGIDAAVEFLIDVGRGEPDTAGEAKASRRLAQIMAGLSDRYRRILELRFLEGCSVQEAALELGVSVGNAKVLQHRALRRAAEVAAGVTG